MLEKCDDIGYDNPMADNIYMCFVFLAIWKAADGAIDADSFRVVIRKLMKSRLVGKLVGGDMCDYWIVPDQIENPV